MRRQIVIMLLVSVAILFSDNICVLVISNESYEHNICVLVISNESYERRSLSEYAQ